MGTTWYITQGDLNLDKLRASGALTTNRSMSNFVLKPQVLTPGGSYKFAFKAVDAMTDEVGISELLVNVNAPPAGGIFVVTPLVGFALTTQFTLNATLWNDEPEVPIYTGSAAVNPIYPIRIPLQLVFILE